MAATKAVTKSQQESPQTTRGAWIKVHDSNLGAARISYAKARATATMIESTVKSATGPDDLRRAIGQLRIAQDQTLEAIHYGEQAREALERARRLL